MKFLVALPLFCAALSAQLLPVTLGPNPVIWPAAVDATAQTAIVSSSVTPGGQMNGASDLYLLTTSGTVLRKLTSLSANGATWIDLSSDGTLAAYNLAASSGPGVEEIHVVNTSTAADRKIAVDTDGCVMPLNAVICLGCSYTCIRTVHFSPDASKVVYSAAEAQSLYVVNADGSGTLHLPVSGAALAPSPQRVVSASGLLVFTAVQDVYTVHLDGTGLQNLTHFSSGVYPLNATISADGNTIVFQNGTPAQLFVLSLDGSAPRQLTNGTLDSTAPSLSADGSLVAFLEAGQAFLQRTDGTTPPVRLTNFTYLTATAVTLTADGSKALVNVRATSGSSTAVYLAATATPPVPLFAPQAVFPSGFTSFSGSLPPSPGSLMQIQGLNFVDDTLILAGAIPLPTTLAGISAKANGTPMPIEAISPSAITAQLPFETTPGTVNFAVDLPGAIELTGSATVQAAAPEVSNYVQPFFTSNYAMAFHAGTAIPADQAHPASAGEVLESYGVGLGAVTPAIPDGAPGPSNPPSTAIVAPQVKIGNQVATVTFAGLAPGLVGIDQVNVVVPSGLKPGAQSFSWSSPTGPVYVNFVIYVQ
jgi:uncharacterized protein (TIGR03437 family)